MYYIKCSHCNFNNPLKSEYLTFCESCGKKLENNYHDWLKNNPSGTLDLYRKTVCVQENLPATVKIKKHFSLNSKIARIVFAFVVLTAILFLVKNFIFTSGTPDSVFNAEWRRYTYGNFGISIEAPEKLEKVPIEPPAAYEASIEEIEAFNYHPSRGFRIEVKCTHFKKGLSVNLPAASLGCINELTNKPGVTNLEFHETVVRTADIPGIFTEGTYFENGTFMRFENSIHSKGEHLWQVLIYFRYDDKNGGKAAERVMKSLDINFFVKVI